jgi:DNA-binding NarL/FixJ family response regulator
MAGFNCRDLTRLTQRECDVAVLVSEGYSNESVARKLFISKKVVEHHLHNAYAKMQARYDCKGRNLRMYLGVVYKEWTHPKD